LRPHGVRELTLVTLVGEAAHRGHGEQGHRGKKAGQANAEPLPGPQLELYRGSGVTEWLDHLAVRLTRPPSRFASNQKGSASNRANLENASPCLIPRRRPPPGRESSNLNRQKESEMKKNLFIASAMIAALAVPLVSHGQAGPAPKPKFESEKCYGISKAG